MRLLVFIAALLCFSGPVLAEEFKASKEDKKMVFDGAQELARCGGAYQIAAEVMNRTDSPNAGQLYEDTGRGSYIAAAYLAFSTGVMPVWENALAFSESTAESEKVRWLALFEAQEKINESMDDLSRFVEMCNIKWGEYQATLINEARQKMYSGGEAE